MLIVTMHGQFKSSTSFLVKEEKQQVGKTEFRLSMWQRNEWAISDIDHDEISCNGLLLHKICQVMLRHQSSDLSASTSLRVTYETTDLRKDRLIPRDDKFR